MRLELARRLNNMIKDEIGADGIIKETDEKIVLLLERIFEEIETLKNHTHTLS